MTQTPTCSPGTWLSHEHRPSSACAHLMAQCHHFQRDITLTPRGGYCHVAAPQTGSKLLPQESAALLNSPPSLSANSDHFVKLGGPLRQQANTGQLHPHHRHSQSIHLPESSNHVQATPRERSEVSCSCGSSSTEKLAAGVADEGASAHEQAHQPVAPTHPPFLHNEVCRKPGCSPGAITSQPSPPNTHSATKNCQVRRRADTRRNDLPTPHNCIDHWLTTPSLTQPYRPYSISTAYSSSLSKDMRGTTTTTTSTTNPLSRRSSTLRAYSSLHHKAAKHHHPRQPADSAFTYGQQPM